MPKTAQKFLQVSVRSPYQSYFSGTAVSVTASTRLGRFDILPDHTPLFSLLTQSKLIVRTSTESLDFQIQNGILKIKNNQLEIFLNI